MQQLQCHWYLSPWVTMLFVSQPTQQQLQCHRYLKLKHQLQCYYHLRPCSYNVACTSAHACSSYNVLFPCGLCVRTSWMDATWNANLSGMVSWNGICALHLTDSSAAGHHLVSVHIHGATSVSARTVKSPKATPCLAYSVRIPFS